MPSYFAFLEIFSPLGAVFVKMIDALRRTDAIDMTLLVIEVDSNLLEPDCVPIAGTGSTFASLKSFHRRSIFSR